jgi:predicted XRE-type DNA-binding protein
MSNGNEDEPIRGSGDFLKDMGYDNPDEMRIKFALANAVALAIEDAGLTQQKAALLMGLQQSDVSRIVNGVVKDYSVFRLMNGLACLGKDIAIGVSDSACACRKPIGWRLTENRAMLICNERSYQAHCVGGWRSVSVTGSDRGRDLNVAAADHCSATNRPQEAILWCHRPVGVRWSLSPLPSRS